MVLAETQKDQESSCMTQKDKDSSPGFKTIESQYTVGKNTECRAMFHIERQRNNAHTSQCRLWSKYAPIN